MALLSFIHNFPDFKRWVQAGRQKLSAPSLHSPCSPSSPLYTCWSWNTVRLLHRLLFVLVVYSWLPGASFCEIDKQRELVSWYRTRPWPAIVDRFFLISQSCPEPLIRLSLGPFQCISGPNDLSTSYCFKAIQEQTSTSCFVMKTSQELRMLSSVTINCQVPKIVMNSGSQLSEL